MVYKFFGRFFILTLALSTQIWALSGTMGTPIGGMGTGYVKFNARTGDFAASGKVPPAASDGASEFSNKKSSSSGFHLFAGGQAVMKAKTNAEDAKCPLYTAVFDKVGSVSFTLNAFGPFVPGDNDLNFQLATSPLAFFEITAINEGAEPVDVAAAMEFSNTTGSRNLLGGANSGELDAASNNKAISFPGTGNVGNAYLMVDCNNTAATYSAGAAGTFSTTGTLANGAGNLVSAKCNIPAGGTATFKFTLAWWRTFVSSTDRYSSGKPDEENYYYHNFFTDSKAAATFGAANFDKVSAAVKGMVSRVMATNFPEWYRDRLLNNLYPLIHNAQCAKDGRMAFWEGHYPIIGTIDQGEHASLFYTFNWPKNQWQELQYWLRTAHTGVGEDTKLKGQIHHDFNMGPEKWNDEAHFMCPWDNYKHLDYWWVPNTTNWSDLNTMAIFKAYELMLATGNLDSMKIYFPKVLITADRVLQQCIDAGKKLPIKSKSTYDSEDLITPQYASGIALAGFLAVEAMAKFVGDEAAATKYRNWYTEARAEYKAEQFKTDFATGRDFCEGDVAGYSWAHYFGLEPVMDQDFIDEACKRLWNFYSKKTNVRDKLGLWHFYTYDHWGGAEIARGKADTAMIVHKWDYDYYYTARPDFVFWQDLQKTNAAYASYMTGPAVWRSYFQMTGYLIDNANKRLWIRPNLPTEMGNKIVNAPLLNPYGWGTLNYNVDPLVEKQTQSITVSFDADVTVKELILNNNTGVNTPFVLVKANGANVGLTAVAEGAGYEKNIRITFASPIQIGPAGINIGVYQEPVVGTVRSIDRSKVFSLSLTDKFIGAGLPINFSAAVNGHVTLDLLSLNGAKIGTIMHQNAKVGNNSFVWNGKTVDGNRINSSVVILRLTSSTGTVSKKVLTGIR